MKRRSFLKAASAGTVALACPAVVAAQASRQLRFVPEADLTVLDPIWTTATVTGIHAFLVYDTLFGMDGSNRPAPQMAAGATTDDGGRLWRITLRGGLEFHDGQRVLARDCVASLKRWAKRDPFGQALMAVTEDLSAQNDRTLVFRLREPFPLLPNALAKTVSSCPVIMPERLASTDAFTQVTEVIGSGPYRWKPDERVPGARAVYERFDRYRPREDGKPEFTAGPKVAYFDRIEWVVIPDAATAAAALRNGEVDWVEVPSSDLLPMLKRDRGVEVAVKNPYGWIGMLRMNHLHPPFDNGAIRRALLGAVDQVEFMTAVVGDDPTLWHTPTGFFTPGTPLASQAGLEALTGKRDLPKVRQEITQAGYRGERIVMLSPADRPLLKAMCDVGADMLQKVGMNVDYQSTDWGTIVQRRAKKDPPAQGGWNIIPGDWTGMDAQNPASYPPLRGNGPGAWFGWPTSPKIEALRNAWFAAPDLESQKRIAADLQRQAFMDVPFLPLGQYLTPTAYRRDLQGILEGVTAFWNVRRA